MSSTTADLKSRMKGLSIRNPQSAIRNPQSSIHNPQSGRQQPLDLPHDAFNLFLVGERDHKEFVPLADADHAVGEKPDSIQQRIGAEDQADWKPSDGRA